MVVNKNATEIKVDLPMYMYLIPSIGKFLLYVQSWLCLMTCIATLSCSTKIMVPIEIPSLFSTKISLPMPEKTDNTVSGLRLACLPLLKSFTILR